MATKGRLFAGIGAAVFLVTSSALTIAVILTSTSNGTSTANTTLNTSSTTTTTTCPSGFDAATGSKLSGYTPQTKPLSHLEIGDLQKGSGTAVKSGATVSACYIGVLADSGVVFGSSDGSPQTFSLNDVIEGWKLGIPGMKVGGTRELLIPAALGYGSQKVGSIPANSDLVFFVDITAVN